MALSPLVDQRGAKVALTMPPAIVPFSSSLFNAPAATNTAAVVTADADSARPNVVGQIWASLDATPASPALLTVADGVTTVWQAWLATAGEHVFTFERPKSGTANSAMTVTLAGVTGAHGALYADIYRHN